MKTYRADFENEAMEIITASTNKKAITEALTFEAEHGTLFNVTLLDDNYNDVKTIF